MKIRNLLLGSVCAAVLALGSCDNKRQSYEQPAAPKSEFQIAYEPVRPKKLLYGRNNPIDENITYLEFVDKTCNPYQCVRNVHMELIKKSGDIHTIVSVYPSSHNLSVYLVKTDGHIRIAMEASMESDGVKKVYSHTGEICYRGSYPFCSKTDLKKADMMFLYALKDIMFNEHLWYFSQNLGNLNSILADTD